MNTFNMIKTLTIFGFITIFVCAALFWFAQLQTTRTEAQNQTLLALEVSTPMKKYLLLEPIPLNFKLSNNTTIPVTWNGLLELGPDINLITRSETGIENKRIGDRSLDYPIMSGEITQPGKYKVEEILIDSSLAENLFPTPGRYQLWVEFNYKDYTFGNWQSETIKSEPITIDIHQPQGINRRAYEFLKNTYQPVNQGGDLIEKTRLRQYFVDNFRNSDYWKYITYQLAYGYLRLREYEKSKRELLKIADVEFYYSKRVEKLFDELVKKLGRDIPGRRRPRGNPSDAPVARPMPAPTIIPVPLPNNPPVKIPIPNANPNATP